MNVTGSNPAEICEEPLDLSGGRKHQRNIKQSLKALIETRRLAEGKDILTVSFEKRDCPRPKLTPEELQRQNDRKEQNRKAAHRCRQKKKHRLQFYFMERERLKRRQRELQETLYSLEKEKMALLQTLRTGSADSNELSSFTENKWKCECLCNDQHNSMDNVGGSKTCYKTEQVYPNCCSLHEDSSDPQGNGHISFLSYCNESSASENSCSNSNMIILEKNEDSRSALEDSYSSSSDTSGSEGYLLIYESETDSCDMFSNSQ